MSPLVMTSHSTYISQQAGAHHCILPVRPRPVASNAGRARFICRTAGGSTADAVAVQPPASTDNATKTGPIHTSISTSTTAPAPVTEEARALVDQVLEAIQGTDSGLDIGPEQRARVDGLLGRLEVLGAAQQPRPLDNPLLWGNYNVAYTSVGRSSERGEPAGGRFRGRIGRSLFRTAGLFQSVLKPDIATNKVEFRLFGVLPGYVGLRGRVLPTTGNTGDTVQVLFEPPVLCIADRLHLRIGRPSAVVLSTTYLDERVRLGKGSRGSLFVFTRGGAADEAGMDRVGLQRTSFAAAAAFTAFFVSLLLGGAALWLSGWGPLAKAAAVGMWLLGAAVGGVVRQGGLVLDRDDERIAAVVQAEMKRLQEVERRRKQEREQEQAEGEGLGQGRGSGGAAPAAA